MHLVPCLYDNPFEDLFGDEGLGAVCTLSDELKARVKAAPGTGHDEFELHMRLHEQVRVWSPCVHLCGHCVDTA